MRIFNAVPSRKRQRTPQSNDGVPSLNWNRRTRYQVCARGSAEQAPSADDGVPNRCYTAMRAEQTSTFHGA